MGEPNETTVSDWSEGMTKDDLLGKTMRPKLGPGLGSLKLMTSQVKTIKVEKDDLVQVPKGKLANEL